MVILTRGVYGTDSHLEPASSGQSMNCSFSHFRVGFTRESGRLDGGAFGGAALFPLTFSSFSSDSLFSHKSQQITEREVIISQLADDIFFLKTKGRFHLQ